MRILAAVLFVLAGSKSTYVPVPCLNHLVIKDWGKCTQDHTVTKCSNANLEFTAVCTSVKPGKTSGEITVDHPTAVQIEEEKK